VRQPTKAGCAKVFREVVGGAKTDRRQLQRALDQVAAGDMLTVMRFDRLVRAACSIPWAPIHLSLRIALAPT
jgi:DNA invertase Pin-like site-specific DNA recombinase